MPNERRSVPDFLYGTAWKEDCTPLLTELALRMGFRGIDTANQAAHAEGPAFVQNRCFARLKWDSDLRLFCQERKILYQGFSLLTANVEVLHNPLLIGLAAHANATPAQVVFSFARTVGMLPLTGTSNAEHMRQDLGQSRTGTRSGSSAGD